MAKYSAVSGKELIAAFAKIGFVVTRIRGSYNIIKHPDGRTTGHTFSCRRINWTRLVGKYTQKFKDHAQ